MSVFFSDIRLFCFRTLGLRDRYIFTRANSLRLRYTVTAVCVAATLSTSVYLKYRQTFFPYAVERFVSAESSQGMHFAASEGVVRQQLEYVPPERSIYPSHAEEDPEEGVFAYAEVEPASGGVETYEEESAFTGYDTTLEGEDVLSDPAIDEAQDNIAQAAQQDVFETVATPVEPTPVEPTPVLKTYKVESGDTVSELFERAGLDRKQAFMAVEALSKHYDPKHMKPGQKVKLHLKDSQPVENILENIEKLVVEISPVKFVELTPREDLEGFDTDLVTKALAPKVYAAKATINSSLYASAANAGISSSVISEVIRLYSWSVDFQRDIRKGDKLEVLYEKLETADQSYSKQGDVLYAKLTLGGKDYPLYRFETKDKRIDYFDTDGVSIRKTLMRTPVDGARLSSGFGMRRHPVLGYNKMHKGLDFAAPTGTPIFAAGDGVIEKASRNGGYGNYVRIRHNGELKTAYAHLHRFAKGISKGKRVKQGDVIGYIGTTGRSTGPHLHYEVHQNGKQVNPHGLNLPTGEKLDKNQLRDLRRSIREFDSQYAALINEFRVAKRL